MMTESIQHKLDRIRSPRVQITYDVEIGNAIEMKELPFVMGILADLSGKPMEPLPKLKERKFVEIDRDNFNEIMASIRPRLTLRISNKLTEEEFLNTELFFPAMDEFSPLNITKQVPQLADIYEKRTRLKDLLTKLDGNDGLESFLQQLMTSADDLGIVKSDLDAISSSGTESAE